MASVFDLLPCDSSAKMVTSIIQTRIFTTTGPLPLDCDNVIPLDDQSSCNVWANALQNLSVIPCSSAPSDPSPPPDFDPHVYVGSPVTTLVDSSWLRFWVNVDPTWSISANLRSLNGSTLEVYWKPGGNEEGYPPTDPDVSFLPISTNVQWSLTPPYAVSRLHFAVRVVVGNPADVVIEFTLL